MTRIVLVTKTRPCRLLTAYGAAGSRTLSKECCCRLAAHGTSCRLPFPESWWLAANCGSLTLFGMTMISVFRRQLSVDDSPGSLSFISLSFLFSRLWMARLVRFLQRRVDAAVARMSLSQPFFRPFGAASGSTSLPRLAPWAAFSRRFRGSTTTCLVPLRYSVENSVGPQRLKPRPISGGLRCG